MKKTPLGYLDELLQAGGTDACESRTLGRDIKERPPLPVVSLISLPSLPSLSKKYI